MTLMALALLLRGETLGYVSHESGEQRRLGIRSRDRKLDRELLTVRTHCDELDPALEDAPRLAFSHPLQTLAVGLTKALRDDQVRKRLAERSLSVIAKGPLRSRVEVDDSTFAIHADDAIECRVEDRVDHPPRFEAGAMGPRA